MPHFAASRALGGTPRLEEAEMGAVKLFSDAGLERHIRTVIDNTDRTVATAEPPAILVARFIEGAGLAQCGMVAEALAARLAHLEKRCSGIKAANLEEAASFAADAALDIKGAMAAEEDAPCSCGKCDSCVAARSDEDYRRTQDACLIAAG